MQCSASCARWRCTSASTSTPTLTARWRLCSSRATSALLHLAAACPALFLLEKALTRSSYFPHSYLLVMRDTQTGGVRHLLAKHIIVCHGILGRQYLPEVWFCRGSQCRKHRSDIFPGVHTLLQERGLTISKSFTGTFSMSGRMEGRDCAVSSVDINGKVWQQCLATQARA